MLLLFSCQVVSASLWLHRLQHTRLSCPSLSPGVYLNSCPLSWWCHPTISASVIPLSSCRQSFPVSGSFPMSQLFTSCGQSTGASASVLPMNIQDWFPLGWSGWISLLLQQHSLETSVLWYLAFFMVQPSHPYIPTGKTIPLTLWTFVGKVMSLLFNTLSRFVIAFIPRSKRLLVSCLQSPSEVILEPKKIKSVTFSTFPP